MASFFNLTLDTKAPSGVVVTLNGGAVYTGTRTVTLKTTLDSFDDFDLTGFQMKVWGIDSVADETDASWESYMEQKTINLTAEEGLKTVYVKVRDDVGNETTAYSANITLQTDSPVVTVSGPDRSKISKVNGFNNAVITFTVNMEFEEYKVCVVSSVSALEPAGKVIGTQHGSINTSGNSGSYPANTPISVTINGADLDAASPGDGVKIIKVFAKKPSGEWSVA